MNPWFTDQQGDQAVTWYEEVTASVHISSTQTSIIIN